MRTISVTFLLSCFLIVVLFAKEQHNALINETSPYLRQHIDNPVKWYGWHPEVLQKAVRENKPIFLSIGYSTCHWCHVMAKESFQNKEIAKLLNQYFISIKVDREELPQIDAYFQDIYYKLKSKEGGWPLNVFMTPHKEVFYISRYIPPQSTPFQEGFMSLLPRLYMIFEDKQKLKQNIDTLAQKQKIKKRDIKDQKLSIKSIQDSLKKSYNHDNAGFGFSRQFPEAQKSSLLYDIAYFSRDKQMLKEYYALLDTMALRGLYDQVDGGFFRYSVDELWEIPHFEKMLYNQAELIELYTNAYLHSSKQLYKNVVDETVSMLMKHFTTKEGLFYSASDAQSDGVEGKYYTFTQDAFQNALLKNPYKEELEESLDFRTEGNFGERVHVAFDGKKRPKGFLILQKELQKLRTSRNYPFIDKKINTAWNAMLIKALYRASLLDKRYKKIAKKSLKNLLKNLYIDETLYHQRVFPYPPKQRALLEDYAFLIAALLEAYEDDFEQKNLLLGEYLFLEAKKKFYKDGYWFLSEKKELVSKNSDKYYTSASSQMILNAIELAAIKGSRKYENFAKESIKKLLPRLKEQQSNAPALTKAFLMLQKGVITIKSSKENLLYNQLKIAKVDYPYLFTKSENHQEYLTCTLQICFAKEDTIEGVLQKIKEYRDNF